MTNYRNRSGCELLFVTLGLLLFVVVPARAQRWRLAWSDEFKGTRGVLPDQRKWTAEVGGWGWGNKELEYYTAEAKNAHLDGRGGLIIKALQETLGPEFKCWYGPCQYTSARLITRSGLINTRATISAWHEAKN